MAGRSISADEHDVIIAAFREFPGQYVKVAELTGIAKNTAHKAWNLGWPDRRWPPIKDVVDGEKTSARAEMLRSHAEPTEAIKTVNVALARDKLAAGTDAVAQRVAEAGRIRAAGAVAQSVLGSAAALLAGFRPLAVKLKAQMEAMAASDKPLDMNEVLDVGRKLSAMTRGGVDAVHAVMEMERLALGEPTEVIGVKNMSAAEMTPNEALARIEAARLAVLDAQGDKLRLIQGGAAPALDAVAKSG